MPFDAFWAETKSMTVRHRVSIVEMGIVLACVAVAAFFAFEIDIFVHAPAQSDQQRMLELDEVMALATLLTGGLLIFAYRRLSEQQSARSLAFEDPLTGLPNRRRFDDALRAAVAAPPRSGGAHGVLLLDLNGFKRISLYGHPVGDEALIQVATRLRRAVRDGDLVARLGGDEFAILSLHLSGPDAAAGIALRVIEELRTPVRAGGQEHVVGAGVGLALTPLDGTRPRS